jgi:hypothetical protein
VICGYKKLLSWISPRWQRKGKSKNHVLYLLYSYGIPRGGSVRNLPSLRQGW